ncbi:MAG TPA: phospho-sugar mutase, partial [Nocardioides sp.]|nr:phospho-sugar mutase [Nocardioides sp.]
MTTSAATDVLLERARAWAAGDPDDISRAELEQIIADVEAGADPADLADRFAGTLEFGTAGLRGAVGAGPN